MSSYDPPRGPRLNLIPLVLGLIAICAVALKGCQSGPFGRTQVVALNPGQEAQLGEQSFEKVLSESRVLRDDAPLTRVVRRIGGRLAEASERPQVLRILRIPQQRFEWRYSVVVSDQVNAFCLPGGKVVVYTGIVPVAETEAGLATVMGHEIGHALAHHGAERMAQQEMVQIGQQSVAGSLGGMDEEGRRQVLGMLGAGSQFGILLPFSRKHESEADHIGLVLMASAGYDPVEAMKFWQRMEKSSGNRKVSEFSSTHPSHERRARDIENWLTEAKPLYDASEKASDARLPSP